MDARVKPAHDGRRPRSPERSATPSCCGAVRCRAGVVTDAGVRYGPGVSRSGIKNAAPRRGHETALRFRPVTIAQMPLHQLARRRARQLGLEIDALRAFDGGEVLAAE